jgi:hypothetical protein
MTTKNTTIIHIRYFSLCIFCGHSKSRFRGMQNPSSILLVYILLAHRKLQLVGFGRFFKHKDHTQDGCAQNTKCMPKKILEGCRWQLAVPRHSELPAGRPPSESFRHTFQYSLHAKARVNVNEEEVFEKEKKKRK